MSIVIITFTILEYIKIEKPFYCSNDVSRENFRKFNCIPCPKNSYCDKGEIKFCKTGFKKQQDECYIDKRILNQVRN